MRTVQAGEKAVSIWFSGETAPGERQALALVRQALAERGWEPWPETVLEIFAAGGDTLVIARRGEELRRGFRFSSLEELLAAAEGVPGAEGSLYWDGAGYILIPEKGEDRPALYEFGEPLDLPPGWESFGREQGMCLMDGDALAGLRRFSAV